MSKKEKYTDENSNFSNYEEYRDMKRKERELEKEEKERLKREARRKRHIKKLEKKARLRPLKNFLWWFSGFCSFIVILGGAIFGTLYFVKVKDVLGDKTNEYVSEEIGNKSFLQAGLDVNSYTVGDIPAIKTLINSLNENAGLSNYITIDLDSINNAKIVNAEIFDTFKNCIKITATLASVGALDFLGNLGKLNIINDYDLVLPADMPNETSKEFNCKLYYYKLDDGNFERAFDDDHKRYAQAEGKDLYYPALKDIPVLNLGDVINDRLNTQKVSSLIETFGISEDNSLLDILGDRTFKEMQSFDSGDIQLNKIISDNAENARLYTVLRDITECSSNDEIKIGNLNNADIKKIRLASVLEITGNEKLYDILCDMTNCADNNSITIQHLTSTDISRIKLKSVIEDNTGNIILDKLMQKENVTVGNIGEELNKLTLAEIYEVEVFTKVAEDSITFSDGKIAKYKLENGKYIIDTAGEYYISKKASIWLFMLYDTKEVHPTNADGFGVEYQENSKTLKEINSCISDMTKKISNTTVRQLVCCGILADDDKFKERTIAHVGTIYLYSKTLQESIGAGMS